MRRLKKRNKKDYTYIIKKYIEKNIKEYLIVSIIFLVGIILGVIFFNNTNINQNEINSINNFVNDLKEDYQIDFKLLFKNTIINNSILLIGIWLISMITAIGILVVCSIILIRGFLLGYTISLGVAIFGLGKGILFNLTALLFQNSIYIPCLVTLGVSSIKLYKSIINNKKNENIKLEILKHTIISLILSAVFLIGSLLEVYVSGNLITVIAKYI